MPSSNPTGIEQDILRYRFEKSRRELCEQALEFYSAWGRLGESPVPLTAETMKEFYALLDAILKFEQATEARNEAFPLSNILKR